MFAFFLKFMRQTGFGAFRTAEINKPLFARLLLEFGFSPHDDDVIVELLPKASTNDHTPTVNYFTDRVETVRMGNGRTVEGAAIPRTHDDTGRYEFYRIRKVAHALPPDAADDRSNGWSKYTPLQTSYSLEGGYGHATIKKAVSARVGAVLRK